MLIYRFLVRFLFALCLGSVVGLLLTSSASAAGSSLEQPAAPFPFSDGFESGSFGNGWTPGSAANGVAQIRTDDPHSGTYHAFLGQLQSGTAYVSVDLLINLANQTDVYLDFWWRTMGDVDYGAGQSGVYISDDSGANWKKIKNFGDNFHYSHEIINLANAAANQGLNLNNHFLIRFYFEKRYNNSGGHGIRLDDIRLTTSSEVKAVFPLQNGFESPTFAKGFYPISTGQGVAEISNAMPHSGNRHISLGQNLSGISKAALFLLVNLSNQTDVYLDFWWRTTGNVDYGAGGSGIYISDDNGANWKKIKNFGDNLHYSHEIINLTNAAAKQGLTLNDHFLVSFHFERIYSNTPIGSIQLDDVRLTRHANVITSFPLHDSFETQTFKQGLYPISTGVGVAEIRNDTPYTGTYHVSLGQNLSGISKALLVLLVDLSNQTDVYLDFWWRTSGDVDYGARGSGIYISDDYGATWKKIKDFGNNLHYRHEIIDLATVATNQGLRLNDHFLISFHFERIYTNTPIGSIRLDDIRLDNKYPANRVYLPFVEK